MFNWIAPSPPGSGWTYQSGTYTVPSSGVAYVVLYSTVYRNTSTTAMRVDDGFLSIARTSLTVVDSLDYLPFGEQIAGGTGTTHKFTGKERDSESGLDNFGARYYSSQYGRFMIPDPKNAGASGIDPQSWNAYSYVGNNPMNRTDPTGLFWEELKNWFRWGTYVKDDKVEFSLRRTADQDRAALGNGKITYQGHLLTSKYLGSLTNKQVFDLDSEYVHAVADGNVGAQINTKNGVVLVGGVGMEGHHFFPKSTEFRQYFDAADINVEDFVMNMPAELHRQLPDGLHTGTGRGGDWNQSWRDFFRENPNATQEQIFQQGEELIQRFPVIEPYVPENFLPKQGQEP
jgi:RHS repeat-associated protein